MYYTKLTLENTVRNEPLFFQLSILNIRCPPTLKFYNYSLSFANFYLLEI